VQKNLLLTDSPHMLRSTLVFRGSGFTVISYPIPLPAQWFGNRKALLVLREYVGLLSYALTDRFRLRFAAELQTPPADVMWKLTIGTVNCQRRVTHECWLIFCMLRHTIRWSGN